MKALGRLRRDRRDDEECARTKRRETRCEIAIHPFGVRIDELQMRATGLVPQLLLVCGHAIRRHWGQRRIITVLRPPELTDKAGARIVIPVRHQIGDVADTTELLREQLQMQRDGAVPHHGAPFTAAAA